MSLLKTKYGLGCKALSNNSNSLMYYEVPGGGGQVCPKLNCLIWGKLTKQPDGTSYKWGDVDPTSYLDGYEWGYDCQPIIFKYDIATFQCTTGDWIDSGSTLTYSCSWEMSFNGGITWLSAVGIINTDVFTDDQYKPIVGVNAVKATVTVTSPTCTTGSTATTIFKI